MYFNKYLQNIKRIVLVVLILKIILDSIRPEFENKTVNTYVTDDAAPPDLNGFKKILYWNDFYGQKDFGLGVGQDPFLKMHCPQNKCYVTDDRSRFDAGELDAMLWNLGSKDRTFPLTRSPHTVYMMLMLEGPHYTNDDFRKYNGIFNWTFTYRWDSDIHIPYGHLEPVDEMDADSSIENERNYAENKTKMAAWLVSHCNTRGDRAMLGRTLSQYLAVDVYGKCDGRTCDTFEGCNKLVYKDYKFYLAFENSICNDYITEKLFRSFGFDIIPVVYGKGYEKHGFPENSYIDIFDFESIKDLSKYLNYLDKNDTAYNEYFIWKGKYKVSQRRLLYRNSVCTICERLHERRPPEGAQVYENMHQWWIIKSQCLVPKINPQLDAYIRGISKTEIKRRQLPGQVNVPSFVTRPNKVW